jgi:hypothetical protein
LGFIEARHVPALQRRRRNQTKDQIQSTTTLDLSHTRQQMKNICARYSANISLYDDFLEFNAKHPIEGGFKPNVIPDDFYEEHLYTILPDISELWKDKDLFLAFREYLYQQIAHENLSFFLEASEQRLCFCLTFQPIMSHYRRIREPTEQKRFLTSL